MPFHVNNCHTRLPIEKISFRVAAGTIDAFAPFIWSKLSNLLRTQHLAQPDKTNKQIADFLQINYYFVTNKLYTFLKGKFEASLGQFYQYCV